jgi:hypothetical protein
LHPQSASSLGGSFAHSAHRDVERLRCRDTVLTPDNEPAELRSIDLPGVGEQFLGVGKTKANAKITWTDPTPFPWTDPSPAP